MPNQSAKKPPEPETRTKENLDRPEWKVPSLADLFSGYRLVLRTLPRGVNHYNPCHGRSLGWRTSGSIPSRTKTARL